MPRSSKNNCDLERSRILEKCLTFLTNWASASISQSGYKDEFFRLFSEAYHRRLVGHKWVRSPDGRVQVPASVQKQITHEDIRFYVNQQRDINQNMQVDEEHLKIVQGWWEEWEYAWDKANVPRHRLLVKRLQDSTSAVQDSLNSGINKSGCC
jgi:hypothetical protein